MTAFGKLVRTTAFRLTLVYLLLFAMFAAHADGAERGASAMLNQAGL